MEAYTFTETEQERSHRETIGRLNEANRREALARLADHKARKVRPISVTSPAALDHLTSPHEQTPTVTIDQVWDAMDTVIGSTPWFRVKGGNKIQLMAAVCDELRAMSN